ncbi:uracil-DNA glycosylase [Sphaerotilus sp.]|uniref:uracil-DNA glycosylase n=1 Tax=Sphaerotilus sp. TaxID=2093942 RepID=UPI002ACD7719|nr:uracil-DNA glycosylase [Sphaerotilus sp.]MDZ7857014.1 uracil-DNA glycosylase [Sphaerotilus sp.]
MLDNRLRRPLAEALADVAPGWDDLVAAFVASPRGAALCRSVDMRVAAGAEVYPAQPLRALQTLRPSQVRVVILGQDPYHGPGEAEGLAFSVADGVKIPPSLRNIRQELVADVGVALPVSGSLRAWVEEGVLLLNTSLTVERDRPASHARLGWDALTDALIDCVAAQPHPKVFMLWGAHAQAKGARIEQAGETNRILVSNHPSPLAARRPPVPFVGSRPFSTANAWLLAQGSMPIDWGLG